MIKFKKFMSEGGNARMPNDPSVASQKIPTAKVDRKKITNLVLDALDKLNKDFEKTYKDPLWKDFKDVFKSLAPFSGSAKHFFDPELDYEEFKKVKSHVGDIDVMFDEKKKDKVHEFVTKNAGKKYGSLILKGKASGTPDGQAITIFELPKEFWNEVRFIQVDFEPAKFDDSLPSEYSLFSHSSAWSDMKEGIKGLFVKFLFRSITSLERLGEDAVVVTKTGKVSKAAGMINPSLRKFFVAKGIRIAFKPILEPNGTQKKIDGKRAFEEIPTGESTYEQSLDTIFSFFFGKVPTKQEKEDFQSFVGCLEIMKKYMDAPKISIIFDRWMELVWGKDAQELYRGKEGADQDFREKDAAVQKFVTTFPSLKSKKKELEKMAKEFYSDYGTSRKVIE